MHNYKTIIFDLDGTLFQTDLVFIDAMNKICESKGIKPFSKESLLDLIGEPTVEICKKVFGESLCKEEIQTIRDEIREIQYKKITGIEQLYEGVESMLDTLKKEGYTLCICTNGSRQYVDHILKTCGIREYFTTIKPIVEGLKKYQHINQILEENESCSAIVVGDTITDIEAASYTNCLSIGVSYGYGGDCYKDADFIADNTTDICMIIKKINGLYKDIAMQILERREGNKPFIVGINGVDTSGKTTFTKELNTYLSKLGFKTQMISLDDFHNPSHIRNKGSDPVRSYIDNAFDLIKIEDELMKPLVSEGSVDKELTILDMEDDKFMKSKRFTIDKDTIVLFEGVLLYREPIDQYFDFRIYLDISFDEVLSRAKKRDMSLFGDKVVERYNKKYIPIQKLYIEYHEPRNKSDVIIDNEDYLNPKISSKGD